MASPIVRSLTTLHVSTHSPERSGWLWVGIALLAYAFLYDNSTSLPTTMGYRWTRLLEIPRQARLAEIALIAGLLGIALSHGVSRTTRHLLTGTFVFLGLGLASYLRGTDVGLLDGVRLVYLWVLPVFLFIIGREAPWQPRAWWWGANLVFAWVLVSAVVSWVQFAALEYPVGDDITGLNKDAHANGTLMMFTALQCLALGLFHKHRRLLLVALALLVTMVLSSVLKVMFLGVVATVLLIWVYVRTGQPQGSSVGPRGLPIVAGVVLVCVSVAVAFSQIDVLSSGRLGDIGHKLVNEPQSLGPLQAHEVAIRKVSADLPTLALGLGLYRYANPISVGQVLADGRLGQLATTDLLAINDEKGEQARVTLSSSLLAEFGVIASLVIGIMYVSISLAVWRCRASPRLDIRSRSAGLLASGILLVMIPLTSLFGSLEVMSVSWPVMLLSGMLCREAAAS
jgi:hypothetical protein